ncbi:MAG: helix-turn-helix domain-containing protein [Thermoanaerobaculia bacterium]
MPSPLRQELDEALAAREVAGAPGRASSRRIAGGAGWSVDDVICTSDARDRAFEERHSAVGIAFVVAGSFAYRSTTGRAVLAPGATLLGNADCCFECGHEHGAGDRCIAFQFSTDFFERVASDAGIVPSGRRFRTPRLPPLRELTPWVARACTGLRTRSGAAWEELAIEVAARVARLAAGAAGSIAGGARVPAGAEARVVAAVRQIDDDPAADHSVARLADTAKLSRFHFLRSFERVTGVTPHQFVLRARVRAAALRLATSAERVIDVAYESGFGDLANFHHTFRAELGATPARYRRSLAAEG